MRDHHGRPAPTDETPDTVVTVWEIAPAIDSSYTSCVIRCYQDAVAYAQHVVQTLMDDPDQEYPCSVQIRQSQMARRDLDALDDADYWASMRWVYHGCQRSTKTLDDFAT